MYDLKKGMRDSFREFLEILFQAAALVIDTIRTFFLIVLSILGPIAFCDKLYGMDFNHAYTVAHPVCQCVFMASGF